MIELELSYILRMDFNLIALSSLHKCAAVATPLFLILNHTYRIPTPTQSPSLVRQLKHRFTIWSYYTYSESHYSFVNDHTKTTSPKLQPTAQNNFRPSSTTNTVFAFSITDWVVFFKQIKYADELSTVFTCCWTQRIFDLLDATYGSTAECP